MTCIALSLVDDYSVPILIVMERDEDGRQLVAVVFDDGELDAAGAELDAFDPDSG